MKNAAPILLATIALLAPLAAADSHGDCDSKGQSALGIVDAAGAFYVDDRNYLLGNGVWVYEETNGLTGLQRGSGTDCFSDCEICYDDSPNGPDTLIF